MYAENNKALLIQFQIEKVAQIVVKVNELDVQCDWLNPFKNHLPSYIWISFEISFIYLFIFIYFQLIVAHNQLRGTNTALANYVNDLQARTETKVGPGQNKELGGSPLAKISHAILRMNRI